MLPILSLILIWIWNLSDAKVLLTLILLLKQNEKSSETLRTHILDLESAKVDLVRNLNQFKTDKEAVQRELDEVQLELHRHKLGTNAEAELESARKNYTIMKEAYSKMRTEHLELLRSVSILLLAFSEV